MALTFIDNTRFAVGPNSNISVSRFLFDRAPFIAARRG